MFYFSKYVIISWFYISVSSGFNDGWAHSICQPASNLPDKLNFFFLFFLTVVCCACNMLMLISLCYEEN